MATITVTGVTEYAARDELTVRAASALINHPATITDGAFCKSDAHAMWTDHAIREVGGGRALLVCLACGLADVWGN